jgi:hypothetical protein
MSFHEDFVSNLASHNVSDHLAMGHATITGTGKVVTGLSGAITTAVLSVKAPAKAALSGHVAGWAATGGEAGSIDVSVFDVAGDAATAAAVVSWVATDV